MPPPGYPIPMRALLALSLLLVPADEAETARDALTKSLTTLDRPGVDRACAALVKLNDDRGPAFRSGLLQYAAFDKDRLKLVAEMAKVEVVRDKDGKVTKGDGNKWTQLKYE